MEYLEYLLERLDYYRKFPRFQLERHFYAILIDYIPQIINHCDGTTDYSIAFLEFPIQKKLLGKNSRSELESVSFDYALFDKSNKKIGIVELKTDTQSNNKIQDTDLEKISKEVHSNQLIEFIKKRKEYKNSVTKKFEFLYEEMLKESCVDFSDTLVSTYKISPTSSPTKIEANGTMCFSLAKIAETPIDENDKTWGLLREYLVKWNNSID